MQRSNGATSYEIGIVPNLFEGTQLAVDADDHPVMAATYPSPFQLGILHCNDVACAGNDDIFSWPLYPGDAGLSPAMVLDSAGNPVIAHWGSGLNITHCNDLACSGNDELNAVTPASGVNGSNRIALDSAGRPVVLSNGDRGFLLATCDDAPCTAITKRPRVRVTIYGADPGLGLDSSDRPIMVFPASPQNGLMVIHCGTRTCDSDTDGDGCDDLAELSTGPTDHQLHTLRCLTRRKESSRLLQSHARRPEPRR